MQQLFFWLMALALFLKVGDYISTVKGMDRGLVEKNPLNKFLFSKLGLPVTTFIEALVILVLACFIASQDISYGVWYIGVLDVTQTILLGLNVRKLLK